MAAVVVVGAGVSGLAVAYRLQQRMPHADITVLEERDRPGGAAWTLHEAGFTVEMGPNGFLDSKPTTLQLCRDLGLGDQLVSASEAAGKNRFLLLGDQLRMLPGGLGAFLGTDLLSWRGKLSFLAERFRGKPAVAIDESIDTFARRRAGREVAEVFADALVTGIYAGDPKLLSLPACFPRVAALEREYGSVMKGFAKQAKQRRADAKAKGVPYERPGRMWSFAGGLRVMVEAMHSSLKKPVIFGVRVRRIEKTGDPHKPIWTIHAEGRDAWRADAVVLTCPAHQQAPMLAELDGELSGPIAAIPYNRVVVAALGFRRQEVPGSLDGFGFIAPQRSRRDLLGVQWCSSIYPQRAPDGMVLLRALAGGWGRPEIVDWSDEKLIAALRAELTIAQRITAPPSFVKIVRWPTAIPQYHVGHLARVAHLETRLASHPGLLLGGNAYRGVALNDCTEQGDLLAQRVQAFLAS
jgi:oxygen-dependent protoporphyrinogen oxidase